MTDQATDNKPFLRALKCAYKLHKAGLTVADTLEYLYEAQSHMGTLPSAATPAADLIPATFTFGNTVYGERFWQAIQDRVFNKAPA